ncbi:MAG: ABC transporter ATP-binding protein [Clostridia bacterium]|nr:ABC transporter ATP-binding protein [Deltaproteobacteria bacterium]
MLRLADVSKRFGTQWALANVNLELDRPGVVLVTGENGAGKTTLLKVVSTAQRPTLGAIELFGNLVFDNLDDARRSIGVITHQAHLYFDLTPTENLLLMTRLAGRDGSAIAGALERVGLAHEAHRQVRHFSAGMKRRVSLAKLLLQLPKIALLDEPFTQLDPGGVTLMEEVVKELRAAETLVLLATHDIERGTALADVHLKMDGGRAVTLSEVPRLASNTPRPGARGNEAP